MFRRESADEKKQSNLQDEEKNQDSKVTEECHFVDCDQNNKPVPHCTLEFCQGNSAPFNSYQSVEGGSMLSEGRS